MNNSLGGTSITYPQKAALDGSALPLFRQRGTVLKSGDTVLFLSTVYTS